MAVDADMAGRTMRAGMASLDPKVFYTDVPPMEAAVSPEPSTGFRAERRRRYRTGASASRARYAFYLLINAALLFGLAQCIRALISDVFHLSALAASQTKVQKYYAQTRQENQLLQHKIRLYSSPSGIEELARNYLNMVGQDELPVRFQPL